MRILITGGTGMIGRRLCPALIQRGHELTVLSRSPKTVKQRCGVSVMPMISLDEYRVDSKWDAIINLAGESIVDQRWTNKRKQILRDSRIVLTQHLLAKIGAAHTKPAVLLSGSAIGVYGNGGDIVLDEFAATGSDFGAQLCADWEDSAMQAARCGMRVCLLRTGLVLDAAGGMLNKMRLPFSLGLGARIGDGRQWMSWIHVDDYVALVCQLLEDATAQGIFNMVAPHPVTNQEFTQTLARTLGQPAFFVIPAFVLEIALGEMANLLTGGQRVLPAKAQALAYSFQYPDLSQALMHLFAQGKLAGLAK